MRDYKMNSRDNEEYEDSRDHIIVKPLLTTKDILDIIHVYDKSGLKIQGQKRAKIRQLVHIIKERDSSVIFKDTSIEVPGNVGYKIRDQITSYCNGRYESGERRVIVIVIARYSLPIVKRMVSSHYDMWHYASDSSVDFFWLGYNAGPFPNNGGEENIGRLGDDRHVYFNTRQYLAGRQEIENATGYKPKDIVSLLLCDYYGDRVHYENSALIQIEPLLKDENDIKLRLFMEDLIELCSKNDSVKEVKNQLKCENLIYSINIKGLIGTAIELGIDVFSVIKQ